MSRIGFIGLDTSHVTAFAAILNDPTHEYHIPGNRVTVGWPGGSPDFALSRDRVAGFTETLRTTYGVNIVDSPEAVAEACDLIFIESADGRVHLEQFKRVLPFGKPTFIDKPFSTKLSEAREIARLAKASNIPLMSGSSLRFVDGLQAALAPGRDDITGCDAFGPMSEEPTQPGLFWYGCHSVEMMVTAMGPDCRDVRCLRTDQHDLVTATWNDGRVASIHGVRGAHTSFGITLHRKSAVEIVDCKSGRPGYVCLLAAILNSLPHGRTAIPVDEMLAIVAIIEAANESRRRDGAPVKLS